jgi:hypothetical protein
MSLMGQKRRIEVVGDESGLPPIAAVPLHCGEPTFRASRDLARRSNACFDPGPKEGYRNVQRLRTIK